MGTGRPYACLAALALLASSIAWGAPPDGRGASSVGMRALVEQVSHYPERWCIDAYLANRRSASPSRFRSPDLLLPTPFNGSVATYAHDWAMWDSLRSLPRMQVATLWQGRHRALVLGFQDGGYFGFSFQPVADDLR